jgi:HD-GYP domain-containing protein (c-di-GMP phosphodiesterase class II)
VAAYAEQIAKLIGLRPEDVDRTRRAALVHDLGLVGVSSYALNKPAARLTSAEKETMRLHPYHGERILTLAPIAPGLAEVVGAHHERIDGTGYFRGLRDKDIPQAARIVAVASRLDELTHDAPGSPACSLVEALHTLDSESGTALDGSIVQALRRAAGQAIDTSRPARSWPAGLTDREVQVLRLATKGLTRRDVAGRLGISENTVRHHLEHIYNKTGTSTRVGATLFAMENDLIE